MVVVQIYAHQKLCHNSNNNKRIKHCVTINIYCIRARSDALVRNNEISVNEVAYYYSALCHPLVLPRGDLKNYLV